jgi:hypothetical protein
MAGKAIEKRRLTELADEINDAVEQADLAWGDALQHAIEAGEKLIEAKALCRHGEWLAWLDKHCTVSDRQSQKYMQLARNPPSTADLTIDQAVAALPPRVNPKRKELEATVDEVEDVARQARSVIKRMGGDDEADKRVKETVARQLAEGRIRKLEPQPQRREPTEVGVLLHGQLHDLEHRVWPKLTGDWTDGFEDDDFETLEDLIDMLEKLLGNLRAHLK